MSTRPEQLDARIEIVTPENIAFKYRVAGPFRRLPAYVIDVLIRLGVMLISGYSLMIVFQGAIDFGIGIAMIIWFVLSWFYGGFFETYWNGQTPGKWALGLRVVSIDGQPINAMQAVMRNVLRAADALPVVALPAGVLGGRALPLFQLGLFAPAFNDRWQRLGDLACGTMVVVEEGPRLYGVARVAEPEAIRLADLIPLGFEPSRSMARRCRSMSSVGADSPGAGGRKSPGTWGSPCTGNSISRPTQATICCSARYIIEPSSPTGPVGNAPSRTDAISRRRSARRRRPPARAAPPKCARCSIGWFDPHVPRVPKRSPRAMKVAELLERRRQNWRELEQLCLKMEGRGRKRLGGAGIVQFASLYRSACADLALADAYQLPANTVLYLHQLVARAHNQLYRGRWFEFSKWGRELFRDVPRRLLRDRCLWIALAIFWGFFGFSLLFARTSRDYREQLVGKDQLHEMQEMYSQPLDRRNADYAAKMGGFYIQHNTSIGLECFAGGLLFGVGGLVALIFNAAQIGAIFGYMSTVSQWDVFSNFVTAHGPFELTAIVLSGAAGMRLGFAAINTHGMSRMESLRQAGREAMPTMGAAIAMFAIAALIEGFLSPSPAPYAIKATVAIASIGLILFYIVGLGSRPAPAGEQGAADAV